MADHRCHSVKTITISSNEVCGFDTVRAPINCKIRRASRGLAKIASIDLRKKVRASIDAPSLAGRFTTNTFFSMLCTRKNAGSFTRCKEKKKHLNYSPSCKLYVYSFWCHNREETNGKSPFRYISRSKLLSFFHRFLLCLCDLSLCLVSSSFSVGLFLSLSRCRRSLSLCSSLLPLLSDLSSL